MKPVVVLFVVLFAAASCWADEKPNKDEKKTKPVPEASVKASPDGKHLLTDDELDTISAGGFNTQTNGNEFSFAGQTTSSKVDGSGSVEVVAAAQQNATSGLLLMQDSAQSGSKSFININAVNSQIQVLLNLNVNINSTVGTLRQINLSGK